MTDGVLIAKEDAIDLLAMLAEYRLARRESKPSRSTIPLQNQIPLYFKNSSGETVPAYACMQVTDTVEVNSQNYLVIDKPADADGTAGWYVFNGRSTVADAEFGLAFAGPMCRMLTDGSTVTAGDVWRPVASAWTIEPGGDLFIAAGDDDIETDVMKGFFKGGGGGTGIVAITDTGGIAARTSSGVPHTFPSAVVDLLDPTTGDYYSPNRTETVYNSTSITIDADRIIQAKRIGTRYFVDVDDCS